VSAAPAVRRAPRPSRSAAPTSTPPALPRLAGLPPVLARHSRALVLGSFPGVASLQAGQYYAHPRNQFWPLLGALWGLDLASWPYARRLAELRRRGLGVWDAYAACRRPGSLDQAIRDAELNDFAGLRRRAPALRWVLHNGAESARVRQALAALGYETLCLPSTSPANASWRFEAKVQAWGQALRQAGLVESDASAAPAGRSGPAHRAGAAPVADRTIGVRAPASGRVRSAGGAPTGGRMRP
jgi:hypoxanthine-DNA glycosylase